MSVFNIKWRDHHEPTGEYELIIAGRSLIPIDSSGYTPLGVFRSDYVQYWHYHFLYDYCEHRLSGVYNGDCVQFDQQQVYRELAKHRLYGRLVKNKDIQALLSTIVKS